MRFKRIYVEITNICNLQCSFCSKSNRLKEEMSVEKFSQVIEKIKKYTNCIYLHIKGEPLLHSKLDEILDVCDKNQMMVKITTNGTLLKKQKDVLLKHHIKQLNISLHCEQNNPDYFQEVMYAVDDLSKKMTVVYRLWALDNLKMDDKSTRIVEKVINYYQLSPNIVDKIKCDKNIKLKDHLYLDKDIEFIWPNDLIRRSKISDYGTCLGTKTHLGILVNGDIVPCCLDSEGIIRLGNIFEDDLDNVINSNLFQEIKQGFNNHRVVCDLCKNCTYRLRFDTTIESISIKN